jgi:hypothetical protein
MVLSTSAERYDFGTIPDGALKNLLFWDLKWVGTSFDSHHPLYFFAQINTKRVMGIGDFNLRSLSPALIFKENQ